MKSLGRSVPGLAIAACLCVVISSCGNGNNGAPSSSIKLKMFQAATVVIGQPDFTDDSANQGSATPDTRAISLARETEYQEAWADDSRAMETYLADTGNNRVLGFNHTPTANDASADFVLGQDGFTSDATSAAANGMDGPEAVVTYKNKLIVTDTANNRVLIWNNIPTSSDTPADVVLGQPTFGTSSAACSATGLSGPEGIAVTPGGKLIVADHSDNRVLIWNSIPSTDGAAPNLVLGQNNFTTCVENNNGAGSPGTSPNPASLSSPAAIWSNGKKLVVADDSNNRVLVWNKFPTSNFQPADEVLGQSDFSCGVSDNDGTGTCTSGNPSAQNMNEPAGVYSNGTQLFIADHGNNRVLIWNKFPTKNFQPAKVVLGQPNFTCGAQNNDGSGRCASGSTSNAQGLFDPSGVFQSGNRIFVADGGNNRYLIFKGQ